MSEPLTDKQLWVMRQGCDSEMGKALDEIERLRARVAVAEANVTALQITLDQLTGRVKSGGDDE